jgi:proline iminopeptidase
VNINWDQYFERKNKPDAWSGGITMVPVATPLGSFSVWTKRTGSSRDVAVLFLHGGPGATHEYFEACDSFLPAAGIEYHYYDQLGSGNSEVPDEPSLWTIDRFVEEVEQVRVALGLGPERFFLFGQSWGGVLAIEYALRYQHRLKGMIVSNMMSSIPAYNAYAESVIMPAMDQAVLAEIKAFEAAGDTDNPRYEELLLEHHYVYHVLRRPLAEWPEPVVRGFAHINKSIYVPMQGPSELGASGALLHCDLTADLSRITVPTLVIGAAHDTMDPAFMEHMSTLFPRGRYLHCPEGSHLAMYDDQETYFAGLIDFLRAPDASLTT